MEELLFRMITIKSILSKRGPQKDKVIEIAKQFGGLEITHLQPSTKKTLESNLGRINQILTSYPINAFEDYRYIPEHHLSEMLKLYRKVCNAIIRDVVNHSN